MVEKKVIYPVLTRFFDCYLKERNIAKTLSIVADDLYSLGTGDEETATNKEEFTRLLEEEIKSIPDSVQNYGLSGKADRGEQLGMSL